ncbi:YjbQ family protein [Candidatus Micrarchaeota archaeon]|nr:YjbQ family protein [Candidatus Micrarchaeota archaeon]
MNFFEVQTRKQREVLNITERVEELVRESKLKEGVCLVFVPHATAGVIVNEFEPNITRDYLKFFEKIAPKNAEWEHNAIDDNAEAHLLSAFLGQGKTIPISEGKLVLGTWQRILLCELDGPRNRKVVVQVTGK